MVITPRSRSRDPQRRHVPRAGDWSKRHARDALAASQGRGRALARDGGARRADAGGDRDRRRPGIASTPRRRRCPRRSTSSSSRASSARRPCRSRRRSRAISRCRPDAEFVIEGYIDPREALVTEGPFGDHTGFYSLADLYPQVHVTAVTMREESGLRRRRSWAGRRWRTTTSATRPSGSSCRC